jgi:formate dehydrogenase maturation protein FdhE
LEDVEKTLQIDENYAKVSQMDTSADMKLSLLKRFVNWLTVEDEAVVEKSVDIEAASTESEVEADNDQMEDQMDIEILKDALNSVFDQKMTEFAASLKEEVEASVDSKIEEVTKSADAQREELEQKLAAAEASLAEQTEKVEAFAAAGAVKKSVDPDDDEDGEDELVKSAPTSFWSNIYLPQELVKALGYES